MVVNYLAILVVSIVSFIIGMLWYSPLLFGNVWVKLMGFNEEDIKKAKEKGMAKNMIVVFISVLVMTYVLAYLIDLLAYSDAGSGAILGFIIWLGFLATSMLGSVLWEGKPAALYLINTSHYLVVLVVSGAILGVWV